MSMVTAANGQQRRAELAAFLRSRRERISPEPAGLAPGTRRRTPGLRWEQVPADVQQILDALVPLPASVLNERFDLLAWNAAYEVLWPTVVGRAPCERNVLWLNFMHAECCHPYVNRDEQLSTLVAQLRGAYGRHLGEPAWAGFVRQLQLRSPYFARLWAEQHVASQATYLKIFRHPAHERLAMTTTSLAVLAVPGTRVVVYTPADEVTRRAVDGLLRGEGADARFPCFDSHRQQRAELGQDARSAAS